MSDYKDKGDSAGSITPIADEALRSPPSDGSESPQCTCFDRDVLTPSGCPVHGPAIKRGAQRPFPPKAPSPASPEDAGLAHILWRTARQLVSLLEKEYGFGKKEEKAGSQTRKVTCSQCKRTFSVKDDRAGTVNEVVYCSDCAEPTERQEVDAFGQVITYTGETTVAL